MKRKMDLFSSFYYLLYAAVAIMLLVPLPTIVVESFIYIETVFSFLFYAYIHYSDNQRAPESVLIYTLISLSVNICSTKYVLTGFMDGNHIPLISFMSAEILRNNFILGLILSVSLLIISLVFICRKSRTINEIADRFHLDSFNVRFFTINMQVVNKSITKKEADVKKELIMKEAGCYSELGCASKFLVGNAIATLFIFLVNLIGGTLIGIFISDLNFHEAFKQASNIASVSAILFTLPQLIVNSALGFALKKIERECS